LANPGGIVEHATSQTIRPRPTMALPARGPFQFPAPWGTTGIRITNADDTAGKDALLYTGYSYWSRVNAHQGERFLRVFLCVDRNRGGAGPSIWEMDKATNQVTPKGHIFSPDHPLSWQTGEGWYWHPTDPAILFAADLQRLYRVNVVTRAIETVVDTTTLDPGGSKVLWQWHTSADGRVHSATVKDATTYRPEGVVVYREGASRPWAWFPQRGDLDECQIDKSGRWLLIKDNIDGVAGEDNLIVNLAETVPAVRILRDQQGAAGHSDNGFGYMVAADNWNDLPNAIRVWSFDERAQPQGRVVYHGANWDSEVSHVSHVNARPGPPEGQYVIGSSANRKRQPRNNEIVGFRLDGALEVVSIAPTLVDLNAPGGGDDYAKLPKANVDATGEYVLWTSNAGGPRLDAFLVKVPTHLLGGSPPPDPGHGRPCPVHCP
jgi:hypothetical protein